MNPIADLEALAAEMEEPQPDAVLGCEIGPWTIQLRAIIEALKKRDEAVRKVAEEMESLEAWAEKAMPPTVTMTAEDLIKIIRADGARFGRLAARLRELLDGN